MSETIMYEKPAISGETMKRMAPPPSLFPLHDPDVSRAIPCA